MKKIFAFGLSFPRYTEISSLLFQNNMAPLLCLTEDLLQKTPLELLAISENSFISPTQLQDPMDSTDEFMLLCGFQRDEIFEMVNLFAALQLKRPVMASLTQSNQSWIFQTLMEEVLEEHEKMTQNKK